MTTWMEKYPELVNDSYYTFIARQTLEQVWHNLVEKLNACGPPTHTIVEWKKILDDYKKQINYKLRKKRLYGICGSPKKFFSLTPLEERLVLLLCPEEAINRAPEKKFIVDSSVKTAMRLRSSSVSNEMEAQKLQYINLECICRTCMHNLMESMVTTATSSLPAQEPQPQWYSIIDTVAECGGVRIAELLTTTTPYIKIKLNDELPQNICQECFQQLLTVYNFQKKCLESENEMRELLLRASEHKAMLNIRRTMPAIEAVKPSGDLLHFNDNVDDKTVYIESTLTPPMETQTVFKMELLDDDVAEEIEIIEEGMMENVGYSNEPSMTAQLEIPPKLSEDHSARDSNSDCDSMPSRKRSKHEISNLHAEPTAREFKQSINVRQFEIVVDFLERHTDLAKHPHKTIDAKRLSDQMWERLAEDLNKYGPPTHDFREWRKIWISCKKHLIYINQKNKLYGEGSSKFQPLNSIEKRALELTNLDSIYNTAPDSETNVHIRPWLLRMSNDNIIEEPIADSVSPGYKSDMAAKRKISTLSEDRIPGDDTSIKSDCNGKPLWERDWGEQNASTGDAKRKAIITEQPSKFSYNNAERQETILTEQNMHSHTSQECYLSDTFSNHFVNIEKGECRKVPTSGLACDLCPKKFDTQYSLTKHKRSHKGLILLNQFKKYVCEYCNMYFPQLSALKDHLLSHSGQKNMFCPRCFKVYYTSRSLERHLLRDHSAKVYDCQQTGCRVIES